MNATDFVVGTQVHYEIDGDQAKIKTPEKKEVECKIVRVEAVTTAP
jgi:phage gp45-like